MKRPVGTLIVLVAAAVALCGCGASGSPLRQVSGAVHRSLAVTWARYEVALERPPLFAAPITVQGGRAAYDFRTGLGYEFLQLRLRPGSYQTLFYDYEPTRLLLDPSPAPAGVLPANKAWISVPLTGPSADHVFTEQAEGLAPTLLLDEVAWGAQSASSMGTHVLEGVPMNEYHVTVNLTTALSAARRANRGALATAIEQELHASPSARMSIGVWVNGPGYVGKIEADVPGSGLGSTSFWFSSFTKPYTGTVPPAAQIVPLAALGLGRHSLWGVATAL